MKDSKVITIENVVPLFTANIFDYLVANLIPRIWYASPSNAIFILYRGFIVLEKVFLVAWLIGFSSLLQGSLKGRVVILLINSRVTSMEIPIKVTVACVLV